MLGLGPRSSCRRRFKKSDILTVKSVHIFAWMMFVVRNPDNFQTNSSIHSIQARQKNQIHLPSVKFSSIQKAVTYSSIKIFTKLLLKISKLYIHTITFKSVLRKLLVNNVFYSIDEFLSTVTLIST